MNKLSVEWTGRYPCLCNGKWIIKYQDKELEIPENYKCTDMNTYGNYDHLVDVINEEFEEYSDGLEYEDWIKENEEWVVEMFNKIEVFPNTELLKDLYEQIQVHDWRSGSCGGCI